MMTVNAAATMGIEDRVGSLEVGKVADLQVLATDLFAADAEVAIAANYPLITMVGGVVHHCSDELSTPFAPSPPEGPQARSDM